MKNIDYADFGSRVRRLRRKARMTQTELAMQLGISTSYLGHLERGSRVPSLETLCLLCNTFKVMPRYLLASGLDDGISFAAMDRAEEESRLRISALVQQTAAELNAWDRLSHRRVHAEQQAEVLFDSGCGDDETLFLADEDGDFSGDFNDEDFDDDEE